MTCPSNLARGTERHGRVFVAANIEAEMHQQVYAQAGRQGVSMAEQIRQLVHTGLKVIEGRPVPKAPRFIHSGGQALAQGRRMANGTVQIAVHFAAPVFAAIRARAKRRGTSVSEQIRVLIDWGLSAQDDPTPRAIPENIHAAVC